VAYERRLPMKRLAAALSLSLLLVFPALAGRTGRPLEKTKDGSPSGDVLPPGARARLKSESAQPGYQIGALAFSPDGKTLAVGSQGKIIRLWDVAAAKEGPECRDPRSPQGSISNLAFSPDGRLLASAGDDSVVRLWDAATGKPLRQLLGHQQTTWAVTFAPDGKTLASTSEDKTIRVWDVDTGREVRQFLGHEQGAWSIAFSPDGRLLASGGGDGSVHLWDVTTGKETRVCRGHQHGAWPVVFSPDGRTLISGGWQDHTIRLWEVITGRERFVLRHPGGLKYLALAPDGRTLASGGDGQVVYLWDVVSGKEVRRFEGHRGPIFAVAFAPDGKTLATGGNDAVVYLWDVTPPKEARPPQQELSVKDLEAAWADLEAADPAKAYPAIWQLVAGGARSVAFLREHLKPAAGGVDHQRIERLIADLDSDKYPTRELASVELEKIGGPAETALKRTLGGTPSLEVRRRIERLLEKLEGWVVSSEVLQSLRGLEVLEHIGTPEARQLLEKLARGTTDDPLTQDAKASLERLARRP
jgi:dipeptidyl aminopeptidase/acylaminoacyl peptidase